MRLFSLLCFSLLAVLVSGYSVQTETRHVEITVGNTIKTIPKEQARLARTGQKKVYDYTLYAKQLTGAPDAIEQIEFYPDWFDDTYIPRSYTKARNGHGPVFSTRHDCWGMSTARLVVTMQDGSKKTIYRRIRENIEKDAKFRLVYKPVPIVDRAFGVEMELLSPMKPGKVRNALKRATAQESIVTGWNDKTSRAWKVETDNTIVVPKGMFGVEVVSPILRGESGVDSLKKAAQELAKRGVTANKSCGLHVHLDLTDVKFDGLKRICQNWIKYEEAFDLILPPLRRNSNNVFCLNVRRNMKLKSLSNKQAHDLIGKQTTFRGLAKVMNAHPESRNRYFKLNLQNLVRKEKPRNTIEFRGPAGTCDAAEIERWVRLVIRFVDTSIKTKDVVPVSDKHKIKMKGLCRFLRISDTKSSTLSVY